MKYSVLKFLLCEANQLLLLADALNQLNIANGILIAELEGWVYNHRLNNF